MPCENASRRGLKRGRCRFCFRQSRHRSEIRLNSKRSKYRLKLKSKNAPTAEISTNSEINRSVFGGIAVNIPCQRERCSEKVMLQISALPLNKQPLIVPSLRISVLKVWLSPNRGTKIKTNRPIIAKRVPNFLEAKFIF